MVIRGMDTGTITDTTVGMATIIMDTVTISTDTHMSTK